MLELSWFVCGILYFFLGCCLFDNLVCLKKFKLNINIVKYSIIFAIIYTLSMIINIGTLKPFLIYIVLLVLLKKIYNLENLKISIGVFCVLLLTCLVEIIYGTFIVLMLDKSINSFNSSIGGYIFSNLFVFLISIFISSIPLVKKFIYNTISFIILNKSKGLMFFIIMGLILGTFILYNNFLKLLPNSILLLTNLFCVGVFVFVIGFFREKANNNKIISEYEQLLNYVKVYERAIEEKSKNQHEYKNQLILIKGMLNKNNKKVSNYIDDIICNQSDDDNLDLLRRLQYLPQGGLKGLIYYKVEEMISNGIDVYIDISPKLNKPKVTKIINENLHDLSKIIGVYLDNAIEAVRNVENKYIVIEANIEKNNIVFSFSNTYNGHIDLSRLDKEGYTTKGQGKGYGLSLVKDIINNNKMFEQSRGINGPYYIQKLYIKK